VSDQNRELVRRQFEEVFNKQDSAACDELFAEDYIEHARAPFQSSEPGKVNGPEHMRGVVRWLRSQFSDIEMTVEAIVADGDLVVARVRTTGTNDGNLNGMIPPTGKTFDATQSHWFRVENGKLVEHWATRDDLTSMLQLGIIPPPGSGSPR
jgi:predicted ester cyclase